MKETKPFLLVIVSIFLLISVGLLSAAIYLYYKKPADLSIVTMIKNPPVAISINSTRDSLEKIYSAAVKDLDTSFTATPTKYTDTLNAHPQYPDSLNNNTANTSAAFDKLRNEINTILQDKSPSADLELAKMKIGELQALVGLLKNKNTEITKENERLYALLKQLAAVGKTTDNTARSTSVENNSISKPPTDAALRVDNIQLSAISGNDFTEKETTMAEETDKLVGSFMVKNGGAQNTILEVMVVVLQPNGKVLQNSNWETGIFYTKSGKQIYSNKLRFDNNGGETKKLNFSLQADKYLPGKYTVEVYHNGLMIGKTTKILS